MRIGIGYDIHRLKEGRKLIIGGVEIPYEKGLDGHSDADVLVHAIIDALLGAASLGDIGTLFPDSEIKWKDANSLLLLKTTNDLIREKGFVIGNIDCVVITEKPKLMSYINSMREKISEVLSINKSQINIKAKTNEKLDAIGNGEGISSQAVVLLEQI